MSNTNEFEQLIRTHVLQGKLSPESDQVLATVEKVAQRMTRRSVEDDLQRRDNLESLLDAAHAGLMGIDTSTEYGGHGLSYLDYIRAVYWLGKVSGRQDVSLDIEISHVVQTIIRLHGSERQKRTWLPLLAQGYVPKKPGNIVETNGIPHYQNMDLVIASFGQTEEFSGSDAQSMRSTLVSDKRGVLRANGVKSYITNWSKCGVTLYSLNENTDQQGHAIVQPQGRPRITSVIIKNSARGHKLARVEKTLGHTSSITGERQLQYVRVTNADIVGSRGKGFNYLMEGLDEGRYGISATFLGGLAWALDRCREYVVTRRQFGKYIIEFPQIRERLAFMEQVVLASTLLLYHGAMRIDSGLPITYHAAITKNFVAIFGNIVAEDSMIIHGSKGYSSELGIDRVKRDGLLNRIGEGTDEIIRMITSRNLIKHGNSVDDIDTRLMHMNFDNKDDKALYDGIVQSQAIIGEGSKILRGYEKEEDRKHDYNRLADLATLVEATKVLFDFGLNLKAANESAAERVLAMAKLMAIKMAEAAASSGNQFRMRQGLLPIYSPHAIYINVVSNLIDAVANPYLEIANQKSRANAQKNQKL